MTEENEKVEMKKKAGRANEIQIEKVVLSIGSVGDELEKGVKLLERITKRKAKRRESKKRIPTLGVRPGLEVGCMVTLRGGEALPLLKKLFATIDNKLKAKQISNNTFSFGIKEYIEIPGIDYQRDIGIMGFDVSVSFAKPGKRVIRKKIKKSRIPAKQHVGKEEIIHYLRDKLGVEVLGKNDSK